MNNVNFIVNGNDMKMLGNPIITSGSYYNDTCNFSFNNMWNGYSKRIVLITADGEEVSEPLVNNQFVIPNEAVKSAGLFKLGLVGVNSDGTIISTNFIAVRVIAGANETESVPVALVDSIRTEGEAG